MKPPYLSLKPFIAHLQKNCPIDWDRQFDRPAELVLEIGFGLGDFLVREAKRHPDKNLIGIELRWVQVRRALRKIGLAGITNIRVLQADARFVLEKCFAERSLHQVYTLFPCPWPKRKHEKHRFLSHAFLHLLNSRLVDGGEMLMITDHPLHAEWILSQVPGTGFNIDTQKVPPRFFTKYEKKWLKQGQRLFHELHFTKIRHISYPKPEVSALITHFIDKFNPDDFILPSLNGECIVKYKEWLYDSKKRKGMFRVLVNEAGLVQHFWIEIVKRQNGWRIQPAKGCGIIPTKGLQIALDLLRNAIIDGP